MKKLIALCALLFALAACDLQPKITAMPDNVGGFIEEKYPALLADPEAQPEIYNSAATDYGVYASPELYGTTNVDDYVLYASADDYKLRPSSPPPPQVMVVESEGQAIIAEPEPVPTVNDYLTIPKYERVITDTSIVTVVKGDTLYSLSKKHSLTVDELVAANKLEKPYTLSVGQKIKIPEFKTVKVVAPVVVPVKPTPKPVVTPIVPVAPVLATPVSATVSEITVGPGDTLYSLSRKYSIPVNDLAVMNKLSSPFALSVGQKLKVTKITNVAMPDKTIIPVKATPTPPPVPVKPVTVTPTKPVVKPPVKPVVTPVPPKVSSAPTAPLPKIAARSASKFSWPVRGKILSDFGPKSSGLYNDGINIGADVGTNVFAAENGVVAYAGNELKGMGNLIIVQHSDGWMTVYSHLDTMSVHRGDRMAVGQKIGTVGRTGKVDRPQLHFEIRKGTKAYDPAQYLKK